MKNNNLTNFNTCKFAGVNFFTYICNVKIKKFTSDIFINSTPKPPKPYDNNCPPGHYIYIQAGGNGHSIGDNCGCEGLGPAASIDFILSILMLTAIILIFKKIKTVV